MKRLPVNPFAMCLVGFPKLRVNRLQFLPVYQRRQNEFEPILSQKARCLGLTPNARGQPHQLFRSLVRIRQDDCISDRRSFRLNKQATTVHALEHRPAHLKDLIPRRLRHQRGIRVITVSLHSRRRARIDGADDGFETVPVWLNRFKIGFGG